jgi:hypothetical protein
VSSLRAAPAVLAAACALALLAPASIGGAADQRDLATYQGLGTWIDVYSPSFGADPDRVAAALAGHRVKTLFVQTGNFRQRADVVAPRRLGALVDAAHARGIAVVGWYLPGLSNPDRDLRRARAAISFRTSLGGRFDSFALDIEASVVREADERTGRLLALSGRLRAAAGPGYPLGAIIPSPVGMRLLPRYWPRFPYAALARTYDVVLPMAYFTYRAHGPAAVTKYVRSSVRIIRAATGGNSVPIHVIGGLAGVVATADAAAFAHAAAACGAAGLSLYDLHATKESVWPLLAGAAATTPSTSRC